MRKLLKAMSGWVCRVCETYNLDIFTRCNGCGRPRAEAEE